MRRMLGGNRTAPPGMLTHSPFTHVPLQAWLQPPQCALLVIVSTHAFEHSICPAAEQPHTPPLQTEPAGHALPHVPQLSALLIVSTQAPPEHWVSPPPQLDWHELLLQTCPEAHLLLQLPQLLASAGMQAPLHPSRPAVH
jgi:hypothetical protein